MEQFHEKQRASRTQYFYLNFLIPPYDKEKCFAKSPLEIAIERNNSNLLLHPVFQELINLKWQRIAKSGAWLYLFINIGISLLWTLRLCIMPSNPKDLFLGEFRIFCALLDIIDILIFLLLVISEVRQYLRAKRSNISYKNWREKELERDLEYAHPQWPEERIYIEREIQELREIGSTYAQDKWNYFDWLTYVMMAATITSQACNMYYKSRGSNHTMRGIGSVTLIFLWVRLLNYARPFQSLGLFVVMLSHVVEDTLKFLFLSLHFCIPYMAAFWINFGMDDVEGYTLEYLELLYSQFQMVVVGDYNFGQLSAHSEIMSRLLCATFIFFVGIICLNLFIALMSDTFQRVYDNAKATAVMQRAKFINEIEITITSSRLQRHNDWIVQHCAPLVSYYDDDAVDSDTTTIKRMTQQINENVDELRTHFTNNQQGTGENINNRHGTGENINNQALKEEIHDLKISIETYQAQYFKSLIQTKAEITGLGLMLKELMERDECKICSKHGDKKKEPKKMDIHHEKSTRLSNFDDGSDNGTSKNMSSTNLLWSGCAPLERWVLPTQDKRYNIAETGECIEEDDDDISDGDISNTSTLNAELNKMFQKTLSDKDKDKQRSNESMNVCDSSFEIFPSINDSQRNKDE